MNEKNLVLYHDDNDGFCGAFIAWLHLGRTAEYRAVQYGQNAPCNTEGRNVYVIDFSYARADMLRMQRDAASIVVLDHHETAERELNGLSFCTFNMKKCGARLAWELFWPEIVKSGFHSADPDLINLDPASPVQVREQLALLVDYVEDRDMWWRKLWGTHEVHACVTSYRRDFETWTSLFLRQHWFDNAMKEGGAILRQKKRDIEFLMRGATRIELGDYKEVFAVNCPLHVSDLGHELAKKSGDGIGVTWHMYRNSKCENVFKVSLRSREGDDAPNVAKLAEQYGGGGHHHAAGFETGKQPSWVKRR